MGLVEGISTLPPTHVVLVDGKEYDAFHSYLQAKRMAELLIENQGWNATVHRLTDEESFARRPEIIV